MLWLPLPGFTARQQGEHDAEDATAVADADVEAGKGWCKRKRTTTTTCR